MSEAQILIHVRFAPDGTVTEIGERPASLTAQEWFKRLSIKAADVYEPLAGGRGVFRVQSDQLNALKALALN
jgi:hypothetical protein